MSNEVQVNEVQKEVLFQDDSSSDSSSQSSDQESVVETKSWFSRYEQFLYGVVVGSAAVIFSMSVRSLIRSK